MSYRLEGTESVAVAVQRIYEAHSSRSGFELLASSRLSSDSLDDNPNRMASNAGNLLIAGGG